LSQGRAIWEIV
jgi:hypothetical protein